MRGITTFIQNPTTASLQGAGGNSLPSQGGSGFQIGLAAKPTQSVPMPIIPTGSASLGSQLVSTLLQTQDLNQPQIHGGGGGGHHGGMKMMFNPEIEEAIEGEETQGLKKGKKPIKGFNESSGITGTDENGVNQTGDAEETNGSSAHNTGYDFTNWILR